MEIENENTHRSTARMKALNFVFTHSCAHPHVYIVIRLYLRQQIVLCYPCYIFDLKML